MAEVRDVNALSDARPTHAVPPLKGTFAEHEAPFLAHFAATYKGTLHSTSDALGPYIRGEVTWDALPKDVQQRVTAARPDVLGILQASRARSGRLPVNLTGLMIVSGLMPEDSLLYALKMGAAEIRRALDAHDPVALPLCIDGLGVARDLSYGNALSRMLGSSAIHIDLPVCLDAFRSVPHDEPSCEALRSIAAHTAPLSAMYEQEKIFGELAAFGSTLSEETRAQLSPDALRAADQPDLPSFTTIRFKRVRQWLFGAWARRDLASAMNDLIAVADKPPEIADPVLASFDDTHQPLSWSLLGGDDSSSMWLKFARHWRETQTDLNALATTCELTVSGNTTPTTLPAEAVDARTGRALVLKKDAKGGLSLVAPADASRDAKELEFRVSAKP